MSGSRYATVAVSVDLGVGTLARTDIASSIADRFSGLLVGVAAQVEPLAIYSEGIEAIDQKILEDENERTLRSLSDAERLFRKAARTSADWVQGVAEPNAFLCKAAGAADLVVVGRRGPDDPTGGRMGVDGGTVVVKAGRPVLVVPPREDRAAAKRVLVAWKDTPEARRAITDSLPFLLQAREVILLAVGENGEDNGLENACSYLDRHGISPHPVRSVLNEPTVAVEIVTQAVARGIDLIVAGAYGHSRLREWAFGGVTRELLRRTPCPCLLSR